MAASRDSRHHAKRHGKHQKQTRHFLKVYAPYLPLTLIVGVGLLFSAYWQPRTRHGVLAYATNTSVSGLLQATNQQRVANGLGSLALNSQLDQAAQAKANDMVARNYWSHNTPDGNPPWVFITQAGYSYSAAAENLAYGFATSDDTVSGWMNSPPHRENLLNGSYVDVGFGIANAPNYVGSGNETVVVAMYGAPQIKAAAVAPTNSPSQAAPRSALSAPATNQPAPATSSAPTPSQPAPAPATPTPSPSPSAPSTQQPTQSTDQSSPLVAEVKPRSVSRLQTVTGGTMPWIASLTTVLMIAGVAILVLRHGLALQKVLIRGERYIVRHAVLDATVISFIGLCLIVSQSAGIIR